jgi:hypothetical protein
MQPLYYHPVRLSNFLFDIHNSFEVFGSNASLLFFFWLEKLSRLRMRLRYRLLEPLNAYVGVDLRRRQTLVSE